MDRSRASTVRDISPRIFRVVNGECLVRERRELQYAYNSMIRKFVDQTAAPVPFRSSTRCRIVIQVWLSLQSHFPDITLRVFLELDLKTGCREGVVRALARLASSPETRAPQCLFGFARFRLRSNGFHRLSDLWRQASHHFLPKAIRPILPTCLILNCHSSHPAKI